MSAVSNLVPGSWSAVHVFVEIFYRVWLRTSRPMLRYIVFENRIRNDGIIVRSAVSHLIRDLVTSESLRINASESQRMCLNILASSANKNVSVSFPQKSGRSFFVVVCQYDCTTFALWMLDISNSTLYYCF